jgi:hypothetical protein
MIPTLAFAIRTRSSEVVVSPGRSILFNHGHYRPRFSGSNIR